MSQVDQTMDEVVDSLTGHDENEIETQFGKTIAELVVNKTMLGRAMVFILNRRDGKNDDDARNASMAMPLKEIFTYFAEESAESGKDEPEPEQQLELAPTGASGPDEVETSS